MFIWVTCLIDFSQLLLDRNISFCKLPTFFRSPCLLATNIRCLKRLTSALTFCQSTSCYRLRTVPLNVSFCCSELVPFISTFTFCLLTTSICGPPTWEVSPLSGWVSPPLVALSGGLCIRLALRLPAFAFSCILYPLENSSHLTACLSYRPCTRKRVELYRAYQFPHIA